MRAMQLINGGSQTYSYDDCYQYALHNDYMFFALQNGHGPSDAQCAVSNDFMSVTQFGGATGSGASVYSQADHKVYGGPSANAVYLVSAATLEIRRLLRF